MGVYLSKANTTKESDDGGQPSTTTRYGLTAMQGWRQAMEDAHIAKPELALPGHSEVSLYGVFDGHGGPTVSEWISRHVEQILAQTVQEVKDAIQSDHSSELPLDVTVLCEAMQRTFLQLDAEMQTAENREEIREIYLEHESASTSKMQRSEGGDEEEAGADAGGYPPYKTLLSMSSNPRTLIQALLGGSGSRPPTIRMVEQDGEQYFQIRPPADEDDEDDEDDEERPDADEPKPAVLTTEPDTVSSVQAAMEEATSPVPANDSPSGPAVVAEEPPLGDDSSPASLLNRNNLPAWGPETCGAAAIMAAVVGGEQPYVITANAGDSRCVLCRNGQAIGMSQDHKPGLPTELDRIQKAGGSVLAGRVDGNLNLSRTIGDLIYKTNKQLGPEEQKITAFPDVRVIPITKADEFLILACDGIWDCVSNEEACQFVRERLGDDIDQAKLSKICEELCDSCLAENPMHSDGGIGCDNMTCIVVLLNQPLKSKAAIEQASSENESKMYLSAFRKSPPPPSVVAAMSPQDEEASIPSGTEDQIIAS